jgi:hypothetical protein
MNNVSYEIVTEGGSTYSNLSDSSAKNIGGQMRKAREKFTMYRVEVAGNGREVRTQLGATRGRPVGSKNKAKA